MIKVKEKDFRRYIYLVLLTIIGIVSHDSVATLIVCALQVVIIISKAKFSFVSVFVFILNYCLIPEFIAYGGGVVPGLLGLNYIKTYYFELFYCCTALNLISGAFVFYTNFLKNEKAIYSTNYNFSTITVRVMAVVSIILTILIFPYLSFGFDTTNRFNSGIISFSGWSCIPFFLLSLGLLSKKCKKMVYGTTLFVCFWYVLHGERVDVLGLFVFFILVYFNSGEQVSKNRFKIKFKMGIIALSFFIILIFVGVARSGNEFSFIYVIQSLFAQQTACDVVNVFNAAVDSCYRNKLFKGITYLSYLINCIPMVEDKYSFERLISKAEYHSVGGGLFFAEPIANFGFAFCVFEIILYFFLINKLIKRKTQYRSLVFAELCLSIFRTAWYGLNYPIVTILYFVPFVLVFNNMTIKGANIPRIRED